MALQIESRNKTIASNADRTFDISVKAKNGYYPKQRYDEGTGDVVNDGAITFDADNSTITADELTINYVTFSSTPNCYTFKTQPDTDLIDTDEISPLMVYDKVVLNATVADRARMRENLVARFKTEMSHGCCEVCYFSYGSDAYTGTFVKRNDPVTIAPNMYKAAYMTIGYDVYKSYTDVWGTGSTPAGKVFIGWSVGVYTASPTVTRTGDRLVQDTEVVCLIPIIFLYPQFVNEEERYIVTVEDDGQNVDIIIN